VKATGHMVPRLRITMLEASARLARGPGANGRHEGAALVSGSVQCARLVPEFAPERRILLAGVFRSDGLPRRSAMALIGLLLRLCYLQRDALILKFTRPLAKTYNTQTQTPKSRRSFLHIG